MSIPCKMIPLGNSGLPTGYKRLEYIENVKGGDWDAASIRTGIYPTQNTKGKLVADARSVDGNDTYFVFGCNIVGNVGPMPFGSFWANRRKTNLVSFTINNIGTNALSIVSDGVAHTLEFSKESFKVDGVIKHRFGDIGEFKSPKELMFLSETPNNANYRCFRGKAYSFKLWEGDMPILDYIPALNPSGVPGMFDTVAKTFKKSATTTPFVAGMTLRQVRDINLPVPGTVNTLSLSIPCEVYNDSEAWGVIEAAQQKGWTFTFYWTDVVAYLTPRIDAIVGDGNYTIAYDYQKSILDIAIDTDVSPAVFRQMQELLAQIVPSGITQNITWSDGMPADYTRLEYIESTGVNRNGQYILTGVKPTPDTWIDCNMCPGPMQDTNVNFGIAATTNSYRDFRLLISGNAGNGGAFYWPPTGIVTSVLLNPEWGVMGNFRLKDKKVYVNGVYKITCNDEPWEATSVLGLGGVSTTQRSNTMFGTFKMGVGDELQVNFIPALDSSGIPGMYDTISKTFKTNDGTGQFMAGMTLDQVISLKLPVAPAAPDNKLTLSVPGEVMYRQDALKALNAAAANGWELTIQYREIETPEFQGYVIADYIEKPVGSYAYINTGLSQRLVGYFDYMNTECAQTSDYSRIWGIWPMQSNGRGSLWVQNTDSRIWLYALLEVNCEINTRHDLVHVLCARRIGDSSSNTYVGLGVDGSWPAYTADWPIPDGITETYRMFAQWSAERLYSARFTDIEHKDIASFIPAIDPDGNPCMFDFVRKQPFYNANGSNKFAFTIGLTKDQAESLVLGDKGSGLTIQVPEGTDLDIMQANNPNVTITIQTIPATTN